MTIEYTLDPDLAKKAGESRRINETGLYVGTITTAFACKSEKGTKGVEIMFKADDGRTADYLQVWTRKQDGTALMGEQVIHAIMTCTEQKSLSLKPGKIERGGETKNVDIFPELTGRRIGFLLQKEPYEKSDGSHGDSMLIFMPLEADTKRTAKEKLEKVAKAEKYADVLKTLADRPMRKRQGGGTNKPAASGYTPPSGEPGDDVPW